MRTQKNWVSGLGMGFEFLWVHGYGFGFKTRILWVYGYGVWFSKPKPVPINPYQVGLKPEFYGFIWIRVLGFKPKPKPMNKPKNMNERRDQYK